MVGKHPLGLGGSCVLCLRSKDGELVKTAEPEEPQVIQICLYSCLVVLVASWPLRDIKNLANVGA